MAFPLCRGGRFLSFLTAWIFAEAVVVEKGTVPGTVPVHGGASRRSLVELASAKLQPGLLHRVEEEHRLSPVDYEFYRFSLSRGAIEVDDLFLYDPTFEPLNLQDPQTLLQVRLGGGSVSSSSGNVAPCVDADVTTRCFLEEGQQVVLKLAPGRPVGAYGFTVANSSGFSTASVDFSLSGSSDGSSWKNLSLKTQLELPKGENLMVGPFMLLDTTKAKAPGTSSSSATRWAKELHPAKVAFGEPTAISKSDLVTTAAPAVPFAVPPPFATTAAPEAPAPPVPAAEKVAKAVIRASEQSQLSLPAELASAAAAGAQAVDRPPARSAWTPEAIFEVAKGSGLTKPMLQRVKMALQAVDPKYYKTLMAFWNSCALARDGSSIAKKVSQVVAVAADAGFTVEQQAEASAAAATAALATETTEGPTSELSEVLRAADDLDVDLEKQSKMAAVLETQTPQEQAALLMLLKSAVLTTPRPSENGADGGANGAWAAWSANATAAKVVGERVAKALEALDVDPQKKLQVISAAAAAAQSAEHTTSTTSFDGVKLVVEAAKDAGVQAGEKLEKVKEEAQAMTMEQQKAAARSLEAAGHGVAAAVNGTSSSTPKPIADTVEKVSQMVKAAAASGMTEEQQAEVAATAVVAAQGEPSQTESMATAAPQQDPGLSKLVEAAKKLGLSTQQQDALLSSVTGDPAAAEAILRTLAAASPR